MGNIIILDEHQTNTLIIRVENGDKKCHYII